MKRIGREGVVTNFSWQTSQKEGAEKDGDLAHLEEGEDEQVHLLPLAPALTSPSHRLHMDAKVRWHFGAKRSPRSELRPASRPQVGHIFS